MDKNLANKLAAFAENKGIGLGMYTDLYMSKILNLSLEEIAFFKMLSSSTFIYKYCVLVIFEEYKYLVIKEVEIDGGVKLHVRKICLLQDQTQSYIKDNKCLAECDF